MRGRGFQNIRCQACASTTLRSFISFAGVSIPPAQKLTSISAPVPYLFRRQAPLTGIRPFSSITLQNSHIQNNTEEKDAVETPEEEASKPPHVPWYLQDESQKPIPHPLGKEQLIPPLPENPPPVLEPLLQYISVDAGLEDLTLLDLRKLDPPPALGANLIMIIGTARSLKHLNVAGDRLSRWLRQVHNLRPTADGLLTRNELRVKLRRRARKAKLSTGHAIANPRDDGITTGWICVNIGNVPNGTLELKEHNSNQVEGFAGFGDSGDKARIVVQILSEEKRAELNLERLWGSLLEGETEPAADTNRNRFDRKVDPFATVTHGENFQNAHRVNSKSPFDFPSGQRRLIHSRNQVGYDGHPSVARANNSSNCPESLFVDVKEHPNPPSHSTVASANAMSLLQKLSKLPREEACQELGTGPHDRSSTLYLRLFYGSGAELGADFELLDRLELIRTAILLQHPGYNKSDLFQAFKDVAASGYEIDEAFGMKVVQALLFHRGQLDTEQPGPCDYISHSKLDLAFRVLDHLSLRGIDILSPGVFSMLYQATGFRTHTRPAIQRATEEKDLARRDENAVEIPEDEFLKVTTIFDQLGTVIRATDIQLYPDDIPLLKTLFYTREFSTFWKLWRRISLFQIPRSKEHYLTLFRLHAELGNERKVVKCLSNWVPMMARETPPVTLDDELAVPILQCITVADPKIRQRVENGEPGQWTGLWGECIQALNTTR
ncbi:ATPase synthesis protein 25 mitochondrial [Myotisia sp. PD_48]|nr:ATPase synthesis protein 25 mitochondrial [Myotisia sp. PD_48]